MADIFEEIVKIRHEGTRAALATIISTKGSAPREEGAKMLIRGDGTTLGSVGGGCMEAEIWQEAMKTMNEGKPKVLHFDLSGREASDEGMICGGVMEVFIEPILPQPTLYIFGGGHISLFVAKIGNMVGFKVIVIDDRPEFANAERFPEADSVLAEDFGQACQKLEIDGSSYLVILTRGHLHDEMVLEWALGTEARYIGMIGSRSKKEAIFYNLLAKGIAKESLDRVYAPIGLDIQAETPEEIAVSIAAELVKIRRTETNRPHP